MAYKKYKFNFLLIISIFAFPIAFFVTLAFAQNNPSKNPVTANTPNTKTIIKTSIKTRPVPKAEKKEEDLALTATVILSKRQMCLDFMNSFTKTNNYQFAWQDHKSPEIGLFSNIQNNINGCGQIRLPIEKGKKTPNQAFITAVTNTQSPTQPGMLELLAKQFTKSVVAGKSVDQIDFAPFSKACMLYTENIVKNKQITNKSIVSFGVYLPIFPLDIKTDAPQLKTYAANLNKSLKAAIEKGCDGKGRKSDDGKGNGSRSGNGSGAGNGSGRGEGTGGEGDTDGQGGGKKGANTKDGYGGLSNFAGLGNDNSELDIDDGTGGTTSGTTTSGTTTSGTTTDGTTTAGTTTAGTTTEDTTTSGTTNADTTTAGTTVGTIVAGTTVEGTTVGTTVGGTTNGGTSVGGTVNGTTDSGTTDSGTTDSGTTDSGTTNGGSNGGGGGGGGGSNSGGGGGGGSNSGGGGGSNSGGGTPTPADCTKRPIPASCCQDATIPAERLSACCNGVPPITPTPQGCVAATQPPGQACTPNLVGNCITSVYDSSAFVSQTGIVNFAPQSGFIYNLPNPGGESFKKTVNGKELDMAIPCYSANACSDIFGYWQNYSQSRQYLLNQSLDNYYNTADQLWVFPASAWKNKYRTEYDQNINNTPKVIPLGPMDN